ncbi:MAG: hypothetical protein NXI20_12270, partial [bacterium]|nr:hypothetical protein [bacterium]
MINYAAKNPQSKSQNLDSDSIGKSNNTSFKDNRSEVSSQKNLMSLANGSNQAPAQMKLKFDSGTEYLDNTKNTIDNGPFNKVQNKARALYDVADLNFLNEKPSVGAAAFTPDDSFIMGGDIRIAPLTNEQLEDKSYDYNDRLIEVSHETHHAIDHIEGLDISSGADYKNKVISEFRTFAVQSAVSYQLEDAGKNVSMKYKDMQKSYDPDVVFGSDSGKDGFKKGNFMFSLIRFYIKFYTKAEAESDDDTEQFIEENQDELLRAIAIYHSLKNNL